MQELSAFLREEREHMKAELRESREEARAAQATLEAKIEEMMAPKPALDDEQLTAWVAWHQPSRGSETSSSLARGVCAGCR